MLASGGYRVICRCCEQPFLCRCYRVTYGESVEVVAGVFIDPKSSAVDTSSRFYAGVIAELNEIHYIVNSDNVQNKQRCIEKVLFGEPQTDKNLAERNLVVTVFGANWVRFVTIEIRQRSEVTTNQTFKRCLLSCSDIPPKIDEEYTSSDTDVREGGDVILRCRATGSPTPKIKWRREDQKDIPAGLKLGSGMHGVLEHHQSESSTYGGLSLHRYQRCTTVCKQENHAQRKLRPPMIWIPNQLVGAPLDTEVVLDCGLESHPKSVTYWTKEEGVMILSNAKYNSMLIDSGTYKSKMNLRIRDLKPDDYGAYTCVAKNSLGETEGTIKLYEIPRPTSTSSPAPQYTSKMSKTDGSQQTTTVRKAELSTELLEKESTVGGIAAAAASDHEFRETGGERKESRRRLNKGQNSSAPGQNYFTSFMIIGSTFFLLLVR
ncbi:lachesin [Caerostris extrusa]|uniref:Lachesin n=1 Tax=Caerostris extrusa TaxID=172846 RepID=A0AAV4XSS3_CAEEX|nr:lachesin [Caerostris extrusa]